MAKVKVKLQLGFDPKEVFNKRFQDSVGLQVVLKMRQFIAQGISPVKGAGRFEAYAAQRNADAVKSFAVTQSKDKGGYYRKLAKKEMTSNKAYPNSVKKQFPAKQLRPVNLELNGKFLDTLGYESYARHTYGVEVGHIELTEETKNLFEAHNEGLNKNVPKRKYLPNKRGEEFVATIMSMIKAIYADRIRSILKKK